MPNKIKIAVLGIGRIGHRHCEHIQKYAELVGIADIIKERAEKAAEEFQTKAFTSLDEMTAAIDDIDLISICTPNYLHAEHTLKSLKAGAHVLCEKPMALSVEDCEKMITAAEHANRRLFIVKQNRFNPPVAGLKKAIDDNQLGKILSIQLNCFWNRNEHYYQTSDWKGSLKKDGGILFTQFSHFIDLLYWLIGDIEDARAFSANYIHDDYVEFEDTLVSILKFKDGAMGTINCTINSYDGNYEGSLTIFGEKGTVKIGGQYLNLIDYQKTESKSIELIGEGRPPNKYGKYEGSMSNHDLVYRNLIDVLQNGGQIATSGIEGLKTVQIVRRIYDAIEKI